MQPSKHKIQPKCSISLQNLHTSPHLVLFKTLSFLQPTFTRKTSGHSVRSVQAVNFLPPPCNNKCTASHYKFLFLSTPSSSSSLIRLNNINNNNSIRLHYRLYKTCASSINTRTSKFRSRHMTRFQIIRRATATGQASHGDTTRDVSNQNMTANSEDVTRIAKAPNSLCWKTHKG